MVKTEFSHRSLHGHPRARRRLLLTTVVVLVLFAADLATGGMIRSAVHAAAASIWSATSSARSTVGDSGYFSSRRSLAEDNASLREQLAQYQERAAGFAVASEENKALRSMLKLTELEQGITAPVVSSFRASPYGTFMIGAGTADAAPGSLVLTEGGFVIGRVVDIDTRVALVNALFAADTETDALVAGTAVSVVGLGGGNARTSVPRGVHVALGDIVTAPSLRGRAIGIVGNVESDPTDADQTVHVRLPVNVEALRYVYVVPAL